MDAVQDFLIALKEHHLDQGAFLGILNAVIGRRIQKTDGTLVSAGLTWRELAALLKKVRWDKEAVREIGLDPDALPPRDRQRYWYAAIAHAAVDSAKATAAGDRLAKATPPIGYVVGPPPGKGVSEEGSGA
jgi:hypothetical protein